MTTHFSVANAPTNTVLTLQRYPSNQESNLQAWDAADEHLLKQLSEESHPPVRTAILNDSFGTLTCGLKSFAANWPLWVETDAKTSLLGTQSNLQTNQLPSEQISFLHSQDPLPDGLELVLLKLPKNLSYFKYQLNRLSQILPQGTRVLIGAKAKSINKSLLALIEKNLGPANASLTYKKTRVITCICDGKRRELDPALTWSVPEYQLTMHNLSNVFASNKLDIGARIMLQHIPQGDYNTIIDLGCGNGILGLRAAQLNPAAHIHFVDDSEMAVQSAQTNWIENFNAEANVRGHFHWDDCLTHLDPDLKADLVLCNPPFHQGEAITDHIAWQMFLDAKRRLASGGALQVVGNRHLAYHVKLKRIFRNCETIASNGKFVILQAIKD